MRSRSFFVILLGIVLALLSVGIGGFYLLVLRDPATYLQQGVKPVPEAITFVPQRAPLVLSLQVTPETIEAYEQSGLAAGERRSLHQLFTQFKENLLDGTGIRYTHDIRPWLGDEAALAVVAADLDRNPGNGEQPGYLLALSIEDLPRAQDFLQVFWEKRTLAGITPQFDQYAGVKITADDQVAMARFGDRFVLISNSPKVLRQALNVVQVPEYGLRSREAVVQAIENLPTTRIGLLYASSEAVQDFLDPDQDAVAVNADGGFVAAIALELQGVRLEGQAIASAAAPTPGLNPPAASSALTELLRYVPKRSLMAFFGTDTAQLFEASPQFPQTLIQSRLKQWRDRWQPLFTAEGIVPVAGEYALALLENAPQPEWIFAARPIGGPAADEDPLTRSIEALNAAGAEQGLNIVTFDLGDRTITAWTQIESNVVPVPNRKSLGAVTEDVVFDANPEGVYTRIGDVLLLASSPEAMNAALNSEALADEFPLQQSLQELPTATTGYLYLEGQSLRTIVEDRLGVGNLFARTQPLSGSVQSLTLGRDRTSHDVGFIQLHAS